MTGIDFMDFVKGEPRTQGSLCPVPRDELLGDHHLVLGIDRWVIESRPAGLFQGGLLSRSHAADVGVWSVQLSMTDMRKHRFARQKDAPLVRGVLAPGSSDRVLAWFAMRGFLRRKTALLQSGRAALGGFRPSVE